MHKSVLLAETVDGLNLKENAVIVDGTAGSGGHSFEIAKRLSGKCTLYLFDMDEDALLRAEGKLKNTGATVFYIHSNFKNIKKELTNKGVTEIDGALFDLGLSSPQLDDSGRGFSFLRDEPLYMTMARDITPETLTAMDVVNTWSEEHLADIIYGFGEERYSRRIAKAIVDMRMRKKIETTFDLVEAIKNSVPKNYIFGKTHPATKTFQAIRIAVNAELTSITEGVSDAIELLKPSGRCAVISFHSLEDRIIKRMFQEKEKEDTGERITKKPITPSDEEIKENPRSRSAKLRIFEKK